MGIILISPHEENLSGPVVFLAGPIQGAPDWQGDAIAELSKNQSIDIISPRAARDERVEMTDEEIVSQAKWQATYIQKTITDGVFLCFFPKAIEENAQYAQESLLLLGTIIAKVQTQSVFVGIEEGFANRHAIVSLLMSHYPSLVIYTTLQSLCDGVLRYIRTQYI